MSKKMTTEGVAGQHGHGGFELPGGKYLAVIIIAAIVLVTIGYFATQTPAKTSQDASTEVKTPAENPAVIAATGAVAIPADVWKVSTSTSYENVRFPITGPFPDILVVNRHTLFKDIKITATEISGIAINTEPNKDGDSLGFEMYFRNGKDDAKYVAVSVYANARSDSGHFKTERPPETLGANWVTIDWFK